MSDVLKRDDLVTATYQGKTVDAVVQLASPNGKSLIIRFEAMLGGHLGVMPVLQDDEGDYWSLMEGNQITLVKKTAAGHGT